MIGLYSILLAGSRYSVTCTDGRCMWRPLGSVSCIEAVGDLIGRHQREHHSTSVLDITEEVA